jgi:hypothetical protein
MVLSIPISDETEAQLTAKARAAGVDVSTYAARYLEVIARSPRPLVEISGTIADAFEASGMSEEELTELLESEKHAMRSERRSRNAG